MYHFSITQELKGGLITDQAAKAARKVAVQLRFSRPCVGEDTQASSHCSVSEAGLLSAYSPPGSQQHRPLEHRGGHATGTDDSASLSSSAEKGTCAHRKLEGGVIGLVIR